jgi:hypothetical protein
MVVVINLAGLRQDFASKVLGLHQPHLLPPLPFGWFFPLAIERNIIILLFNSFLIEVDAVEVVREHISLAHI